MIVILNSDSHQKLLTSDLRMIPKKLEMQSSRRGWTFVPRGDPDLHAMLIVSCKKATNLLQSVSSKQSNGASRVTRSSSLILAPIFWLQQVMSFLVVPCLALEEVGKKKEKTHPGLAFSLCCCSWLHNNFFHSLYFVFSFSDIFTRFSKYLL